MKNNVLLALARPIIHLHHMWDTGTNRLLPIVAPVYIVCTEMPHIYIHPKS